MNRDRLLVAAIVLSGVGGVLSFVVGLGAALSEEPSYWFMWLQGALFAGVSALCASARGRG